MTARRSIRIVKKIQEAGVWKFVSLARNGSRYVWDPRPGSYYLDWWEGRRRREHAGETPSAALTAQRRKQHELAGALLFADPIHALPLKTHEELATVSAENSPAERQACQMEVLQS